MFLDASVIVAVLAREPGHEEILKRISDSPEGPFVSPMVRYEAAVSLARQKALRGRPANRVSADLLRQARAAVDALLSDLEADEIAISPAIGDAALDVCGLYGKTVGHPADLNFGDCFAYACAKALGVPLAYRGNDFALTDLA